MRKHPEIAFPFTIWPHLMVQAVLVGIYFIVFEPQGWFAEIGSRWSTLSSSSGGYLPLILWLVFVLLIGEWIVRKAQILAATLSAQNILGFRFLTLLMVILMFYTLFVLLECVLFWVVAKRAPIDFGPIGFVEAFGRMWVADVAATSIFAMGEILRQFLYRETMQSWHHTQLLRKTVQAVNEDDAR
ncbi:MAG: hypothetical protein KA239_04435 [Bacteroidia bacterium]|nr:hypothetical protein [Bacteroidia bacterium]